MRRALQSSRTSQQATAQPWQIDQHQLAEPGCGGQRLAEFPPQAQIDDCVGATKPEVAPHQVVRRQPLAADAMPHQPAAAIPHGVTSLPEAQEQFRVFTGETAYLADPTQLRRKPQSALKHRPPKGRVATRGEKDGPAKGRVAATWHPPAAERKVAIAQIEREQAATSTTTHRQEQAHPSQKVSTRPPTAAARGTARSNRASPRANPRKQKYRHPRTRQSRLGLPQCRDCGQSSVRCAVRGYSAAQRRSHTPAPARASRRRPNCRDRCQSPGPPARHPRGNRPGCGGCTKLSAQHRRPAIGGHHDADGRKDFMAWKSCSCRPRR